MHFRPDAAQFYRKTTKNWRPMAAKQKQLLIKRDSAWGKLLKGLLSHGVVSRVATSLDFGPELSW